MSDSDVWFVADRGFTSIAEQALKDAGGVAVIAPGTVRRLVRRIEKDYKNRLDVQQKSLYALREVLLDHMEEYDDRVYKRYGYSSGLAEFDGELAEARAKILGLATALAVMEYTHEYHSGPEGPQSAIARVRTWANAQFEEGEG